MERRSRCLYDHGYTTVPVIDAGGLPGLRDQLDETIRTFPEYITDATDFVGGSFCAFGNPSSFHNPVVRRIRRVVHAATAPLWLSYTERYIRGAKLEQIIDRLMVRPPTKKVASETWHRDEAIGLSDGDQVFGGWINLDNSRQLFRCVPGTHTKLAGSGGGFSKISKDQHALLHEKAVYVEVPPGHVLIFFEHIVHEVVSKKLRHTMYRLFTGWRLTYTDQPLDPMSQDPSDPARGLKRKLEDQAPMPIKSGQEAAIWPKLYWTNHRTKLTKLTGNFIKGLHVERKVANKKSASYGETYTIVPRVLPSLREAELPMYPPYTSDEVAMHIPAKPCAKLVDTYSL